MSLCCDGGAGSPGPARNSSRKKKDTDLSGAKLENVLRLQPAASKIRRQITSFMLLSSRENSSLGSAGHAFNVLPYHRDFFFLTLELSVLEWGCCRVLEELCSAGYILRF